MNLQETLDKMRQDFEAKAPADVVQTMHQATKDLEQSGIMDSVLSEGDKAPSFTLPDQDGNEINSSELLASGPLIVTFYRGSW